MFIDGVVVDHENKNISCSINFLLTITKKYHTYITKYFQKKNKDKTFNVLKAITFQYYKQTKLDFKYFVRV